MSHRQTRLRILLALSPLLLSAGCGGDAAPTAPEPVALRITTDVVRPGTFLEVVLPSGSPAPQVASGTLGGMQIAAGRSSDSTLSVFVPDLAAGQHALRLELGDRTGEASVQVQQGLAIANPVQAVGATLDAYYASVPREAPAGVPEAEWARERATLDSLLADTKAKVAGLSPAEQLALARLLASAGETGGAATHLGSQAAMSAGIPGLTTACTSALGRAVRAAAGVVVSGAILWVSIGTPAELTGPVGAALKAAAIGASSLALVASALTLKAEFREGVAPECFVVENVGLARLVSGAAAGASAGGNALTLVSGVPLTVHPVGTFREVNREHIGKHADLAEAAGRMDEAYGYFEKLPQWVRDLLPTMPTALSKRAPKPAVQRALAPSQVRIESVQPSSVSLAVEAAGDALKLTARSSADADEVPFSFDLVSAADASIRTKVPAVLQQPVAGTYVLESIGGAPLPWTDADGEQVLAGSVVLSSDGTFTQSVTIRTYDERGDPSDGTETGSGTYSISNGTATFTVVDPADGTVATYGMAYSRAAGTLTFGSGSAAMVYRRQ